MLIADTDTGFINAWCPRSRAVGDVLSGIAMDDPTRYRRQVVAVAALALGVLLSTSVGATLPPARVDEDRDGIDDALEQLLAERYAPMIYLEPGEENYPINVDWHLRHAKLGYHEDCGIGPIGDVNEALPAAPFPLGIQANLLGPFWIHPDSWGTGHTRRHCDEDNHQHGPITTVAADPDGEGRSGYSDQATFYLDDLGGSLRAGSLDPREWVTYFHTYPTAGGGIMIQYWHTFAYNDFDADDHGGDWDASIQVQLDRNLVPVTVWFSRHDADKPGSNFNFEPTRIRTFRGTHPVVTIDGGGHAAFRSPDDWATCGCTAFSSITGPVGQIVWTLDADAFDDPAQLRKVALSCLVLPNVCSVGLTDPPSGGTVWKTWTAGDVRQSGTDLAFAIGPNPSPHGGLINVGEYNPCTALACDGARQASTLLAGQFRPLNGQDFIRYSGRWGSTSILPKDGPRGPVFQGFDKATGVYTSWYNQGGNSPADPSNSPWREPPTTSFQISGGPIFTRSDGARYVTSTTPLALAAAESPIAAQFGPLSTAYRFFPVTAAAGPYAAYTAPFSLTGLDGTYAVNYFSLDGLNNEEAVGAQVLTLDDSPPTVTIGAPAAGVYVHSATLTLDYSVTDGGGSGLGALTAALDGRTRLAGQALPSGRAIDLLTRLSLGRHTFVIDAVDNLGHEGRQRVTFAIIATPESIKDDVRQFLAAGRIKRHGLAHALLAKLDAAAEARRKGHCRTAADRYRAFIDALQDQRGRGVDAEAAHVMIADARYLIEHCREHGCKHGGHKWDPDPRFRESEGGSGSSCSVEEEAR